MRNKRFHRITTNKIYSQVFRYKINRTSDYNRIIKIGKLWFYNFTIYENWFDEWDQMSNKIRKISNPFNNFKIFNRLWEIFINIGINQK